MSTPAIPARPSYGDYPTELARSNDEATAWTCRCGCPNPRLWDTCQECQRPNPTA